VSSGTACPKFGFAGSKRLVEILGDSCLGFADVKGSACSAVGCFCEEILNDPVGNGNGVGRRVDWNMGFVAYG
jgi:hypothetical protein